MKKQILLATLIIACTGAASAQYLPQKGGIEKLKPVKARILKQQGMKTGAKGAAGVNERLIGVASYQGDILNDSAKYVYGGARYSHLTNMDLGSYQDNFIPTSSEQPLELGSMTDNYLAYDTLRYYVNTQSGILLGALAIKEYDSEDRMIASGIVNYNVGGLPVSHRRYHVDYEGAGNNNIQKAIALVDTSTAISGMFDTAQVMSVQYNTVGRRAQDASVFPIDNAFERVDYTYTPAGRISSVTFSSSEDGIAFTPESRSTYAYDGSGRLVEDLEELYDGAWVPSYLDSFGYTGASPLFTYNKSFEYLGSWEPAYQFDGVLLPGSDAYELVFISQDMGSGLQPALKLEFQYNGNEHMTNMDYYLYAGTGYAEDPFLEVKYYYAAAVSVPVRVAQLPTVKLYPNPATSQVTIAAAGKLSVSVYNLSGQLLMQQSGNALNGALQLDVASLPAGTYLVAVQTENGRSQAKFVKQ